ncbi:ORF MSV207 hypothetical protein [Melanoplus sanguinipes entomopoxvirus]|uniref:Uncharacterized protein n=1 Tax=Melanoplus sanguinipes entomopoxvirus TaxID=83191 RepID=Q9YVN5_MSEPV|nr:ORF MSV207 hypothetical protein [Melanoplus sanguinipes entomopoxvirus]AAC97754.1 ORF MSV207 hypothetical protein [Melanoplus sanguinipes entomopoxvirus 'O']
MIDQLQIKYQKLIKSYNLLNQYNMQHISEIQSLKKRINELERIIQEINNQSFDYALLQCNILKRIYDISMVYKNSLNI